MYNDREGSYLPTNLKAMLTGKQSGFLAAFLDKINFTEQYSDLKKGR